MATIPANNNTGLYNTSGTAAVVSNDITISGNVNANNVNAVNTINAGTNITAGGNVTADYFIGDGSLLTNINAGNIVGGYGNANVAAYLASGSNSSNIVTSGNISGQYIFGNGSQLTGLPATYGNANVNAHLAAFGSNTINTTGNITAGYFIGDGSQLTGLPAVYGNANVAAFLPTYTGNLAGGNGAITNDLVVGGTIFGTFSGNISGNLVVPGSNTQVLFNNNGNAGASADFTFNDATNLLTVSGNVNATAFNGSGAGLTNLPGANVTGTVPLATAATTAGTVTTAAQPNITSVGTLTSLTTSGNVTVGGSLNSDDITSTGNVTVNGNQIITGNLTVQGTTTTINSNTITTNDKTITVANNQSTGANVDGAGLEAGNPAVATWLYNDASQTWRSSIGISAVGNITGGNIIGNGQSLSNLPGANVVGAVANATFATSAGTATSATTAGTVTTNAQPNITSVGTLTSLGVSGNITTGGILTDGYYYANGTPVTFGGGSGTYGNSNVVALLAAFGSNTISTTGTVTTGLLRAANIGSSGTRVDVGWFNALAATTSVATDQLDAGNATITGNISAAFFNGNGRGLTGLSTYGNSNVALFLNNLGTNAISTSGNITGGNLNALSGVFTNTLQATGNIDGVNLNLSGSIVAPDSSLTIGDINTDGNIILNGAAGGGTSGANIDYINGGGYARFYGNVTSQTGFLKSGSVAYTNIDGSAGQALLTYGNGMTYFGAQASTYGNANVAGFLAAFGSNTISTTGNVTSGNISVTGAVAAGGNISGNYILGNGALLTGLTSTYGNSNVTSLLAAFGSNSISTTGNIAGGNVSASGNVTAAYINTTGASGNITGANYINANFFVGNGSLLTGITATANYNNSNVVSLLASFGSNTISTTGNITGGFFVGNGSALTGITASATAGGANTQIQFNNGGAFAGNAAMTFNNTTGNIGLGNLVINGDNLRDVNAINLNSTPSPQRITVGTGYNGNFGANVDPFFITRGGTFAVIDKYNIGNADTNMAQRLNTSTLYADMGGATLTNNARRMQGLQGALFLGNGTQQIASGPVYATATGIGGAIAVGNITGTGGSVIDMGGTATVSHIAGGQMTATIGGNANVGNAVGMLSVVQTFTGTSSNTTSAIGFLSQFTGVPVSTVAPTNVYGFYMPGTTATHGVSNANNWRRATNYYFLRNDDPVAQNQLGSLRAFHEFEHATATSGSITINKNDGQVQNIVPTGNVTISGYSNFVVTASDGTNNDPQVDTVTLIVEQGATPYTITMPTGAAFKYAGGANTVPATANTVVMISVTAANVSGTTTYLTTISPGFV